MPTEVDPRTWALLLRSTRTPDGDSHRRTHSTDSLHTPDRQAGQQVLRFHADGLVGRHRQDQVDGFASDFIDRDRGILEVQSKQSAHARQRGVSTSSPRQSLSPSRWRRHPTRHTRSIDVAQFLQSLDAHLNTVACTIQRCIAFARALSPSRPVVIERHVEPVTPLPIAPGIVFIDDVDVGVAWKPSVDTSGVTGPGYCPLLFLRRPPSNAPSCKVTR